MLTSDFLTNALASLFGAFTIIGMVGLPSNLPAENPADFTLKAVNGDTPFVLSENKGTVVVLHFLLKTECPVCLRTTRSFHVEGAKYAGVTQLFIKPDSEEEISKWLVGVGENSPLIYRDPDATLAKAFSIQDGYEFHGETVHYPATVVLNSEGKEVWRHVGMKNTDRPTFERVVEEFSKAQGNAQIIHFNVQPGKTAMDGYDPTSYFKEADKATPVKGNPELTSSYAGVVYTFATEDARTRFNKTPEKFLPRFGGWSALAMASGEKKSVTPTSYAIHKGRLYLFHKDDTTDEATAWSEKATQNIAAAEAHWKEIINER